MLIYVLFLLWTGQVNCRQADYWSEDYTGDSNCFKEDLILNITSGKEKHGGCVSVSGDLSESQIFDECKRKLATELGKRCLVTKKAGELVYCKKERVATCCFYKHECIEYYEQMMNMSVNYLKNQTAWLEIEKEKGYASCHNLNTSDDASICQSDCNNYESSSFAQQCSKMGGFFKCCVRRSIVECDECRFCCTLLMCTVKTVDQGVHTFFSSIISENNTVNVSTDPGLGQAKELFYLLSHNWGDYRCLNPNSDKDPTKWKIYDPISFANATTKEEMEKVVSYTYEKSNDIFDPEVLKQMTGDDFEKNFKNLSGVDFVSKGGDLGEIVLDCYNARKSDFAKKCRKNKGLFKCCALSQDPLFIRAMRQAANLSTNAYDEACPDPSSCRISSSHHICSTQDSYTGLIQLDFRTPLETDLKGYIIANAETEMGIASQTPNLEIRYSARFCLKLDTCSENLEYYENWLQFLMASEKKTLCKLEQVEAKGGDPSVKNPDKDKKTTEKYSDCLKRRTSNIRICPKKIFAKKKADINGVVLFKSAMKKLWKKNKKRNLKKKKGRRKKKGKRKRKGKKKKKYKKIKRKRRTNRKQKTKQKNKTTKTKKDQRKKWKKMKKKRRAC